MFGKLGANYQSPLLVISLTCFLRCAGFLWLNGVTLVYLLPNKDQRSFSSSTNVSILLMSHITMLSNVGMLIPGPHQNVSILCTLFCGLSLVPFLLYRLIPLFNELLDRQDGRIHRPVCTASSGNNNMPSALLFGLYVTPRYYALSRTSLPVWH